MRRRSPPGKRGGNGGRALRAAEPAFQRAEADRRRGGYAEKALLKELEHAAPFVPRVEAALWS